MTIQTMSVPEVFCGACKTAIEGALAPLAGVRTAVVDITAKQVSVEFDESVTGPDQLVAAIEDQGFTVVSDS